jgi:hypothetical protein
MEQQPLTKEQKERLADTFIIAAVSIVVGLLWASNSALKQINRKD